MQFQSAVLVITGMAVEQYKGRPFCPPVLHSTMSNIIPLLFESTLSASYADSSELVQAMQHLERHLAHIINIRVTSECFA